VGVALRHTRSAFAKSLSGNLDPCASKTFESVGMHNNYGLLTHLSSGGPLLIPVIQISEFRINQSFNIIPGVGSIARTAARRTHPVSIDILNNVVWKSASF